MKKYFALTVILVVLFGCSSEPYVPAKMRLTGSSKKTWQLNNVKLDLATIEVDTSLNEPTTGFQSLCCGDIENSPFPNTYLTCNIDDQLTLFSDSSFVFTEGDSSCTSGVSSFDTLYSGTWSFNDIETTLLFEIEVDPYEFFDEVPFHNEFVLKNLSENEIVIEYIYTDETALDNIFTYLIPNLDGGERLLLTFLKKN